jgi:hypothetical protein
LILLSRPDTLRVAFLERGIATGGVLTEEITVGGVLTDGLQPAAF